MLMTATEWHCDSMCRTGLGSFYIVNTISGVFDTHLKSPARYSFFSLCIPVFTTFIAVFKSIQSPGKWTLLIMLTHYKEDLKGFFPLPYF